MKAVPIPLVGGSYRDETRPWSQQDTCNYLPCRAERDGTRSGEMLKTPPGLYPFAEVTATDPPTYTPVRGTHEAEGRFFTVIGRTLYQLSATGVLIPIGTVPGSTRVDMGHNQISLGNEVVVVNGSAGYVYNTVTTQFERISDPGYPGSSVVKFIDGYIIGIEPQGRYAFNSEVANALSYNTLDRFTSEVTPDRLVAAAVSNNELMLLSASSCEFFENRGFSQQPFRSKRITIDKGCAGPYVVVEADNTVFWLGNDGYFYQLEGYGAKRISTRPIEQAIRGLDWSQAYAFQWEDAGFTVIYWTFPDGNTWGWDTANQEWHRRESYGMDRWRVSDMSYWRNAWYAGDFQSGRIWRLDWDYPLEGDQEFISSRTMSVISDNQSLMLFPRLELVMDTGQPLVEAAAFPAQPEPPTITGDAPAGLLANAYTFTYTLADGTQPYVVTLRDGDLPTGLTLSTTGVLSGTPTAAGDFTFTVRVTDSNGLWAEIDDSVNIPTAIVSPILVTDTDSFDGTPAALTVGESFSVPTGSGTPVVRVTSDGIYAAFSRTEDVGPGLFGWRKWNVGTGAWEDLPNPADMPVIGPRSLAWSSNGRFLACSVYTASPENVVIYERDGDTLTKVTQSVTPANNGFWAEWSVDGSMLALGNGASGAGAYVFDVSGGVLSNPRFAGDGIILAFSPDGAYLAAGQPANGLTIFEVGASALTLVDSDATAASWAGAGVHWTDDGIITVSTQGSPGSDFVNTWTFDAGTGTLAFAGTAASQPPTVLSDSSVTVDGLYLSCACPGDDNSYIYDLSTLSAPDLIETQAVTPPLFTVSWGNV